MSHKILITRPTKQAQGLAEIIAAMGAETVICPVIKIEQNPININNIPPPQAQIITSVNAVPLNLPSAYKNIPLFVVGDALVKYLTDNGFTNIVASAMTVTQLLPIINTSPYFEFIYWRGADISHNITTALPQKKISEQITYRAVAIDELPKNIINEFHLINTLTLYSARSAQIFMKLAIQHRINHNFSNINLLCMSNAVLESVGFDKWRSVNVADNPSQAAMLDKLTNILRNNENG